MLEAGIRVYETTNTVLHAKTAVVDGVWSTVGSSNLDYMSLYGNDEINAIVVGEDFGKIMQTQFLEDLTHAQEIVLDE